MRFWVAPGASTFAAERRTAIQAGGIPRSYVSSDPDQTLRFFAEIWVAFLRLVAGFRRPRKLPSYLQIGSHLNIQSDKLTKPGPWGELNPVIRRVHKLIVDLIFWLKCISWGALFILARWLGLRRFRRVYRTHWYDLSREGPLEEMKWQQIREATEKDPLDHQRCCRWSKEWLTIDCTVLVILLLFVGYIFVLNIHPDWLGADGKNIQELFQEFVLPASALALVGTTVTVFYKVRLTARAKNRQQWINSVRKHIHTLIANCPSQRESYQELPRKCESNLAMLDLLINPSERVPRCLMAIFRSMHGIHDHPFDKKVLFELGFSATSGQEELKVKATRLANVLLKREWEQVKHVK